jgi:hypothetical protein
MATNGASYADAYRNIDFREHPEKYKTGRGEQGVLIAEPYKSEILPHWKFKTPVIAKKSAETIFEMFENYKRAEDFVGMDMARKFLQMGFTRSRRYANHASGNKYQKNAKAKPQDAGSEDSEKAKSARIFYGYYKKAKDDDTYIRMKQEHKERYQ